MRAASADELPAVPGEESRAPRVAAPDARLIALLAAGHCVLDMSQGSLPAVLPLLKTAHALSYAASASLVLVANVTSSLIQPVFGYLSDRRASPWILPVSLSLSGVGFALIGLAPGYWTLVGALTLMGVAVAAYHPQGFKTAAAAGGNRQATALSWFSLGGNVGIALGPPLMTLLAAWFGLYGTVAMLLPAALLSPALVLRTPGAGRGAAPVVHAQHPAAVAPNRPRAMALLILVVLIRSWTQLGFVTFIPFYYIDELKKSPAVIGPLLFVFLGAGALGTVVAGPLADRWGARTLMVWGLPLTVPFGILFLLSSGAWSVVLLGMFGAILTSTFSVTVVLGQQYLPRNTGLASGLIVGLAMGTGGLGVTVLGVLADHYGLLATLWVAALLPIPGFLAALFLPQPGRGARRLL